MMMDSFIGLLEQSISQRRGRITTDVSYTTNFINDNKLLHRIQHLESGLASSVLITEMRRQRDVCHEMLCVRERKKWQDNTEKTKASIFNLCRQYLFHETQYFN